MIKQPFYKRTSVGFLLIAVFAFVLAFISLANALANASDKLIPGLLLGMGIGEWLGGATIWQMEKKLDAKNVEQKTP
jgi:Na+/H+ antiporter NhaA